VIAHAGAVDAAGVAEYALFGLLFMVFDRFGGGVRTVGFGGFVGGDLFGFLVVDVAAD